MLKKWRLLAEVLAKACKSVLGDNCIHVFVVGGAAENRLTVLSDIDIVVIVGDDKLKSLETILSLRRRAEELGLPLDAPLDIKLMTMDEFNELKSKGFYHRIVEVL